MQFTIRGATQNDFADIAETPNALYIDEAYQVTGQSQTFATYDLQRVEILKGPQGTLFGRNATGGLVHFITTKPSQEVEGYAQIGGGSHNSVSLEGAVSGGVTDSISLRFSGLYRQNDSVINNQFAPADMPATPFPLQAFGRGPLTPDTSNAEDLGGEETWSARLQILFEPNDDVEFLLKGQYAARDSEAAPYHKVPTVAYVDDTSLNGLEDDVIQIRFQHDVGTLCEMISVNTGDCVNSVFDGDFDGVRPNERGDFFGDYEPENGESLSVWQDHAPSDSNRISSGSLTGNLTWHLSDATRLVSVTNFSEIDKRQSIDVGSGPSPIFIVSNQSKFTWFTQEVRFEGNTDRTRWIGGFYYLNIDGDYAQGLADTVNGINIFGGYFFGPVFNGGLDLITGTPTANSFIEANVNAELKTNSYSLFGQIDLDLTDDLMITVGARAILEEKDHSFTNRLYHNTRDERVDDALFCRCRATRPVFRSDDAG